MFMEESLQSSVLIVDDSVINTRVVTNMLADLGYKIHAAKDGLQALKLLTTFQPSVILMDITMPIMDGFECCRRIKQSASRAHIPVIFMSGSQDQRDITRATQVGGRGYLIKPINEEQLKSEVEFNMPWAEVS